jgi:hypothetical protein
VRVPAVGERRAAVIKVRGEARWEGIKHATWLADSGQHPAARVAKVLGLARAHPAALSQLQAKAAGASVSGAGRPARQGAAS